MSNTFTLTITDTDTGHTRLTAVVHVDATGTHLVTVRTATSGEQVPQGLAELDFAGLIRTAATPRSPDPTPPASTASSGTSTRGRSRARAAEPTSAAAGRVPRQVPEIPPVPSDFGVTYWRLGSIAKVARHYDVPHRTAQAWIKALQQQGKLANPWPSKKTRPLRPHQ